MKVTSKFTINRIRLKQLSAAAVVSLEQTAEALHTDVVQACVIPRDTGALQGEKTHIKAGETIEKEYEDGGVAINTVTKAHGNIVSLITTAPQARRLYYNLEGFKFHRTAWESIEYKTGKSGKKRKKKVKHDGNPNARDHWYDPWLPGGEKADFCLKAFARFYRRNAKLK